MLLTPFTFTEQAKTYSLPAAQPLNVAPVNVDRARALIFALASADQTYDELGPHLKRALGYERRPLDRQPKRVRAELQLAARKLAVLTRQVEAAMANLPVEG